MRSLLLFLLCTVATMHSSAKSFDPLTVFTDLSCSELKPGVTTRNINKIADPFYRNIATKMSSGTYDAEFRIQTYRPYQLPKESAKRTKTLHTWGVLDNITGIYVANPDDKIHILVGDTYGQSVQLHVKDHIKGWKGTTTELKSGLNVVQPGAGLCYIMIFQDEYIPLKPKTKEEIEAINSKSVNIHFVTGEVNGYFDYNKNTPEDSEKLLSKAQYPYFDVKGTYSQLFWYTEDFKVANTNLFEVARLLDQLVALEMEFSGFFKYGKSYSTRMLFMPSTSGGGNPNATLERVIFPRSYGDFFTNPTKDTLLKRIWGMAHEVGHCSQMNPAMRWGGMGEVGNNMFSMYVKTQLYGFLNSNMLVEGYYEKARKLIIDAGIAHADKSIHNRHFERLVPFWQLYLYFYAKGYGDFYKDMQQHFRTTPDVGTTFQNSGELQLDFVRTACNISRTNLLDFFQTWGFLTPVDVVVKDYGDRILKITQQDIDNLVAEIEAKNYPKPQMDITTIQDNNFNDFK